MDFTPATKGEGGVRIVGVGPEDAKLPYLWDFVHHLPGRVAPFGAPGAVAMRRPVNPVAINSAHTPGQIRDVG